MDDKKNLLETEKRLTTSTNLHKMTISEITSLMIDEEYNVIKALKKCENDINEVIEKIISCLKKEGRLFYVGAGTSGRLGVLDASECPPTFSVNSEMVQGIIAGGDVALKSAVEGAEDSEEDGKQVIIGKKMNQKDIVIGIAASGSTPFVHGALKQAKQQGSRTALITCVPFTKELPYIDNLICAIVGAEILSGSTRLKAGTATKLILNMLSTTAMIHLGKVYENLMVDVRPSNEKLMKRVVRIFMEITKSNDKNFAEIAIKNANGELKTAIVMTQKKVSYTEAKKILKKHDEILHLALSDR